MRSTFYAAKANSPGNPCRCEPARKTALIREGLETDLALALENDEFELEYQPIVDIKACRIIGFEALLRWHHPARGRVSPAQFIPLAEESGLIVPIGSWVLEQACAAASRWPAELRIAVNVSPRQFEGDLLTAVTGALSQSSLCPRRLEIEITESLSFFADRNFSVLHDLKDIGVNIALDDFGTGYSSFAYLKSFNFNKIKIDRSFVSDLLDSVVSQAIVGAIIEIGHSLNMRVTAEGVETANQFEWIRSRGCSEAQGFLFSRPLQEAQVDQFLRVNTGQLKIFSLTTPKNSMQPD